MTRGRSSSSHLVNTSGVNTLSFAVDHQVVGDISSGVE